MSDWDVRFIELAKHIAEFSKDPSTKVGSVIIDRYRRIVSVGYNGLPRNIMDSHERLMDRQVKYLMTIHAEINAILFAQRDLAGCTLYTWPFMSCSNCAAVVIQSGISRHVAPYSDNPRWAKSQQLAMNMLHEAGVELTLLSL